MQVWESTEISDSDSEPTPSLLGIGTMHNIQRLDIANSDVQLESMAGPTPRCGDGGMVRASLTSDMFADPFHDDWAHW
jgi:hypothetical protein